MTDPVRLVRDGGGVMTAGRLRDAGVSRRTIDRALEAGRLVRIRRGWFAVPGADPHLVAAARAGVVLTCVTQARRLGLWVLDEAKPHVAAPSHAGRMEAEAAVVHWATPLVPRHPHDLVDGIENVLVRVAVCQPFEAALATWESAFRQRLADPLLLGALPLPPAARRILSLASPFPDSGLKSFVVPRLAWTKLPIVSQIKILGHHVDFLIGERLVFQIDGGHHVGRQRSSDNAHDAELMLRGYHVIRVGFDEVVNDWPTVQSRLMRAIAQGLHRAHRPGTAPALAVRPAHLLR